MYITFGELYVSLDRWDRLEDWELHLSQCELGMIKLTDDFHYRGSLFSITVFRDSQRLGIGFLSKETSLPPSIIVDYRRSKLIIGTNTEVFFIDVNQGVKASSFTLGHLFYQFYTLSHLGFDNIFLVLNELGIDCLTYDGAPVWTYNAHDIISDLIVNASGIEVNLFEGGKQKLAIATGSIIASDTTK
ncbi:hypothetical protein HC928_02120 [bacterium]|nr:hypothetical protein [bacterium]